MDLLKNFSTREKNLWSELLVDMVAGLYYYPKMFRMIHAGGEAVSGAAMTNLIIETIIVAIFTGIIVASFLHTQKSPEQTDERDQIFKARGNTVGYFALIACVVFIISYVVVYELMPAWAGTDEFFQNSSVVLANLLLVSLFISSVAKTVVQLLSYRRGY